MFNTSKYTTWYFHIIENAKQQNRTKSSIDYFESHHIIPKSIGGNNRKENLVLLTVKEHFICHRLLVKMVIERPHLISMNYALYMLCGNNSYSDRALTKHCLSKCLHANRIASKNRNHKPNLGNHHSPESKKAISTALRGRTLSPEHIEKIKASNMRTNPSRAEKVSKYRKGEKKTDEHKQKISTNMKRIWQQRKLVGAKGIEPL